MIKENLRLILKNRLTWIILFTIFVFILGFTFKNIFKAYSEFAKYVYGGQLIKKPFAIDIIADNDELFSAIMILTVPISLVFILYRNESFETINKIRGNELKNKIVASFSISIVTSIYFFVLYMSVIFTYYISLNSNINPAIYDYNLGINDNCFSIFAGDDILFYDLFWINNGNSTFLYFLIHSLLYSILIFFFILATTSITLSFKSDYRVIVYIIVTYILLMGNSYIFDNIFTKIMQMPGLLSTHRSFDGSTMKSWCFQSILYFIISIIGYFISYISLIIKRSGRIDV